MVGLDPIELADFVAEKAKQDPKVRRVIEDVRLFDGLAQHPGFRRLSEMLRADKDRLLLSWARRLMDGQKVSEEEIAFHRGFYQGAEWVLGLPDQADANLEQAARKAWAIASTLEQTAEEEDSPYA